MGEELNGGLMPPSLPITWSDRVIPEPDPGDEDPCAYG